MASNSNAKTAKNKKKGREFLSDFSSGWDHKRILNKRVMQDIEVSMLRKMQDIYQREINMEIPAHLEFIKKHYEVAGIKGMAYFKAKIKVQEGDFDKKKWLNMMKDADGYFKYEAEQIVKIVCQYQRIRKSRLVGAGYNNDPENLFSEELKVWATSSLCLMDCSLKTRELIDKRCRYLEEVLCEDGLFDRPSSLITHTIQQVIVACRGVLRYRTIPIIDRELAHHDARRAFDQVKKHLVMLMADTLDFCSNVFRTTKSKQANDNDRVGQIISAIMSSENVASAFPNDQAEIRERIYAPGQSGGPLFKPRSVLVLGANCDLLLAQNYAPVVQLPKGEINEIQNNMVKLKDKHLKHMFKGSESGIEDKFRGNPQVTRQFLKLLALVLEVGDFYNVVDKAAACASQGGTLLVYGLANTQLNIMLETCDHLMSSLRESCSTLSRVAELRFEELVFQNYATIKRNPWIMFYRTIHSTLSRIDRHLGTISQETALIKVKANSLTLYEMFQKASQDTQEFLNAATEFASHMSTVLGITCTPPQQQTVVSLPDIEQLKSLCGASIVSNSLSLSGQLNDNNSGNNNMPLLALSEKRSQRPTSLIEQKRVLDVHSNPGMEIETEKEKKKKKRLSVLTKIPRITTQMRQHKDKTNNQKRQTGELILSSDPKRELTYSLSDSMTEDSSEGLYIKSANNSTRNSLKMNQDPRAHTQSSFPEVPSSPHFLDKNDDIFSLDRQLNSISNDPKEPIIDSPKFESSPFTNRNKAELSLENQKLDSSSIPMIKSMITPEITKIDLMRNKLQGSDFAELYKHIEITSLKVLMTLNLSENNIGDEGAKILGYYLIEADCKLQSLTVSYNNITDKGGVQLVESLAGNVSIRLLNMDCNQLTDRTLEEIESSLMKNPKCPLFNLSLAQSRDGKTAYTKAGAKLLWKLMSHRPLLTITGDPPFTFTGQIQKPKRKYKDKKDHEASLFNEIAAESIQRMRKTSVNHTL